MVPDSTQADNRPHAYDREVLTTVLVYHYRKNSSHCGCGWSVLGASHTEHVADVYEESVAAHAREVRDDG